MPSLRESLIKSASEGHLEVFKRLLLPDPSSSLRDAEFTLEKLAGIATRNYHSKVLKYCISIGVDVNDDAMRIGLLQASRLSIYKTVIAAGFEIDYDHDGTTGGPLIWATTKNHTTLASYLLAHGANVNRDVEALIYRPLAKAARQNNLALMDLFIRYGAQMDRSGALIVAAEHGNLEAVQKLISHGADIDLIRMSDTDLYTKTEEEESALHKAVKGGHEDVVAFLVESGAKLSLTDYEGKDALMMAVERGNAEIFQIIYDARRCIR